MASLDELRAAYPDLGFGLYALEPGGPVTFEIYAPDGQTYSFVDLTAAAAVTRAFPTPEPTPQPDEPAPATSDIFS